MTDTERETLCARIDELCQENERLRQQNAKLDELLPENGRWFSFDAVRSLSDERDQLAAENAQLREFAGQVLYFTTMTDGCGDNCPYSSSDCRHECYLREQGHKLGIEVGKCMESNTM